MMNTGVSAGEFTGAGEVLGWMATAGKVTNKADLVPDVKKSWTVVPEIADIMSFGLLPSHIIPSTLQALRDVPRAAVGLRKLCAILWQESIYAKTLGKVTGGNGLVGAAKNTVKAPFQAVQ